MLAFYGVHADELDRIRASGLPGRNGPYAVSTSLEKARSTWPDRALLTIDLLGHRSREEVADETASGRVRTTDAGRTSGHSGEPDRTWKLPAVHPDDLLNVDPYRPPEPIEAAGGYVLRTGERDVELVVIRRRGVWDLPKGTVEPGEELHETAVREVREEVGLSKLAVRARLGRTVHAYHRADRFRVKTTAWYAMTARGGTLRPQRSESIEEVEWTPLDGAADRLGYRTLSAHVRRWGATARRALPGEGR